MQQRSKLLCKGRGAPAILVLAIHHCTSTSAGWRRRGEARLARTPTKNGAPTAAAPPSAHAGPVRGSGMPDPYTPSPRAPVGARHASPAHRQSDAPSFGGLRARHGSVPLVVHERESDAISGLDAATSVASCDASSALPWPRHQGQGCIHDDPYK